MASGYPAQNMLSVITCGGGDKSLHRVESLGSEHTEARGAHLLGGGGAAFVSDHREHHLPQEAGRLAQVLSDPPACHLPHLFLLQTNTHSSSFLRVHVNDGWCGSRYLQQVLGQVGVGQAGGEGGGAPDRGLSQVNERDVAVEGEGMEVRMNEDPLDLYLLLACIGTLPIGVSCRDGDVSRDPVQSRTSDG